jgi:uncharacterized membrane protein YccC
MTGTRPRLPLVRSTIAILIAVAINVVLSIGVDSIFHAAGVFPPMSEGMPDTGDNVLALSYRLVITVFAGVVALRFAGHALGWHAVAIALVGFALGMAGVVVATMGPVDYGPDWYPWSLAISAFPCMWLSWLIAKRGRRGVSQVPPAD